MPANETDESQKNVQPKPAPPPPIEQPGYDSPESGGEEDDSHPKQTEVPPKSPSKLTEKKILNRINVGINTVLTIATVALFCVAYSSLNISDSYFREIKKQFDIANTPYVEFSGFKFTSFAPGKPMVVAYKIDNLGNQPVKIMTDSSGFGFTRNGAPETSDSAFFTVPKNSINRYLIKESSISTEINDGDTLTKALYDSVINKSYSVTLIEEIEYVNLVTGCNRFYTFKAQMHPTKIDTLNPKYTDVDIVHNNNCDTAEDISRLSK